MNSIQLRLTSGVLISLILLLLIQWVIINRSIHSLSEQYLLSRLDHDADALVAAVSIGEAGLTLDELHLGPVYKQPFSGHYFQVHFSKQSIRSRSLWDVELSKQPGAISGSWHYQSGPDGQYLLTLSRFYSKQGTRFELLVAEDFTPIESNIRMFLMTHTWISLIILLVLSVIQVVLIRRNLNPLERVRKELVRIHKGERTKIEEAVPREILPLVREINNGLEAMRNRVSRSRNMAGNLAHALKRPITNLLHIVEQKESVLPSSTKDQIRLTITELSRLIESELKRARLAGRVLSGPIVRLDELLNDMVETVKKIHRNDFLNYRIDIPDGLVFPMEQQDLQEVLGNLLDNAGKWAESQVSIKAVEAGDGVSLFVEDDGDRMRDVSLIELNKLVQRGQRHDETVPGHGLGLSIVNDIVQAYNGSFSLEMSSELGGIKAIVSLPSIKKEPE